MSAPATATVTVTPVNDPPVANNDLVVASYAEDSGAHTILASALLGNDPDADSLAPTAANAGLTIESVTSGSGGTVTLLNGEVGFTPEANFYGTASFTYVARDAEGNLSAPATATVTVTPVNDPPVANNDLVVASYAEDSGAHTILASALLGNDTDADNLAPTAANAGLTIESVTSGSGGTVTLLNGDVVFTPNANFYGTASFTYVARDAEGNLSAPATATVTVTPVNDPPVANNDLVVASYAEDSGAHTILASALLGNDTDADNLAPTAANSGLTIESATSGSALSLPLPLPIFVFTPNANFYGTASFTYVARDAEGNLSAPATATVTVTPVNDPPVANNDPVGASYAEDSGAHTILASALLGNDTDADNLAPTAANAGLTIESVTSGSGGTVTLLNGDVVFTPNANFYGTASFTYVARDAEGNLSAPATATVTVTPVNDPPVANNDLVVASYAEDSGAHTILASALLGNDTDADNLAPTAANAGLTIESVTSGSGGTVTLLNGDVVFTPNATLYRSASFTYVARDAEGNLSAPATATVTVTPVNDPPVANNDLVVASY